MPRRLANERSVLAYTRTGLALAGPGVIAAKWIEQPSAMVAGVALIALGLFVPVVGFWRLTIAGRRYQALTQPRGKRYRNNRLSVSP